MAQQKNQGMRLRQTENPRKKNQNWLLKMLCAMVCSAALLLSLGQITGFGGTSVLAVMVAVSVYLCAMFGLLLRSRRPHWFTIGVLVLLLILVVALRQQVLEGFRLFWNRFSDARLGGTGLLWPQWQQRLRQEQSGLCMTLFGILVAGVTALMVCGLISSLPELLAVVLPGILLAVMAVFGTRLSAGWMILLLASAVFALMCGGWGSRSALTPVTSGWLAATLGGLALVLLFSTPGAQNWIRQTGEQVQQLRHYHQYETEHTTLPEGDFRDYREAKKTPEAALIVTMDFPEVMYLRGFTGGVFENNQWKPIEKELLVKNKNLLYWLNLNAFHSNAQFAAAAAGLEMNTGSIIVQNTGACSRYQYVPFSLCNGEYLDAEDLNTEGVLSDGERVYSYTALTGGSEAIAQVMQNLQLSDEEQVLQYRQAESAYRHFVRSVYLQVPEEGKQLLAEQWDDLAAEFGGPENLTTQQAQDCTLKFLSICFPETGTPEDLELPLAMAAGTTYQYATVAAMTFRYFGIPARYAEGYVITEKLVSTAVAGETLAVDSSCARAWVEVYQDGLGWVPMDLTPGLGEMVQEDPNDQSEEGDSDNINEELDPEEVPEENSLETEQEVPDPDGGSLVRLLRQALTVLLKVLLILLIIFLLLLLRRYLVMKGKEKRFRDPEIRNAVAWIFGDAANILEKQGFDRGNGSLRQICAPAREGYGEEYAQRLETMIHLNDRALFSSRSMEEDHREDMLRFRQETIDQVKLHVKWYRRLWQKWVRCLY